MIPVVTVDEMRRFDSNAGVGQSELVARAGWAVYRTARHLLGGTYGRRVVVVAGRGNNGADGRVAARHLVARGARVEVIEAGASHEIGRCDLVIDAAYGTGLRGAYEVPDVGAATVLAVDIASGVHGDTGMVVDDAVHADATVALAALKPGHLFGDGPLHSGVVTVGDIGLDVSGCRLRLMETGDALRRWPRREDSLHKWRTAVALVAGSTGMTGAAVLASRGAHRTGAGMVQCFPPGVDDELPVVEVVSRRTPTSGWSSMVLEGSTRSGAMVIGPGLGRDEETLVEVRKVVSSCRLPLVLDADGLHAVANSSKVVSQRKGSTVVTPHRGEFRAITGHDVGDRPWDDAARLAAELDCVVLLKGPVTSVADADGKTVLVRSGDHRLATAGTGDVLSGMIGALLARGLEAFDAATCAAVVHGRAALAGDPYGFMAGDLPDLVAGFVSENVS